MTRTMKRIPDVPDDDDDDEDDGDDDGDDFGGGDDDGDNDGDDDDDGGDDTDDDDQRRHHFPVAPLLHPTPDQRAPVPQGSAILKSHWFALDALDRGPGVSWHIKFYTLVSDSRGLVNFDISSQIVKERSINTYQIWPKPPGKRRPRGAADGGEDADESHLGGGIVPALGEPDELEGDDAAGVLADTVAMPPRRRQGPRARRGFSCSEFQVGHDFLLFRW